MTFCKFKHILLYILLFVMPCLSVAQSKPKRDASKDRSVVAAREAAARQKIVKATEAAKVHREETARLNRRRNRKRTPKLATYLTVNNSGIPSVTFTSTSSMQTFYVDTDGKEWHLEGLPYWCQMYNKTSNSFVLLYGENPTHEDRTNWFYVKSDNISTKVNVLQEGAPVNAFAKINSASIEHNVSIGFSKCLQIKANVSIRGASGVKCLICAFICDKDGNYISASSDYPNFKTSDGKVYAACAVTPVPDYISRFDVVINLPNNAMCFYDKKADLTCKLSVYITKTSKFLGDYSTGMNFRAKNKKGQITTKKRK